MYLAKYFPKLELSCLLKDGDSKDTEKKFVNRRLCTDGILDREHQAFPSLSEGDQIFYKNLRDTIHKKEEQMY